MIRVSLGRHVFGKTKNMLRFANHEPLYSACIEQGQTHDTSKVRIIAKLERQIKVWTVC
jgi:hypothetical protein